MRKSIVRKIKAKRMQVRYRLFDVALSKLTTPFPQKPGESRRAYRDRYFQVWNQRHMGESL